jgi:4-oxalocrotonate tautomerase
MPIISVKVIEGFFSEEQKKQMVVKLTEAFVSCTFEATRPFIYAMVEEVKPGQWSLAGVPLPNADFLVNGFPEIVERATTEYSQTSGVRKTRHLAPEAPKPPPGKT